MFIGPRIPRSVTAFCFGPDTPGSVTDGLIARVSTLLTLLSITYVDPISYPPQRHRLLLRTRHSRFRDGRRARACSRAFCARTGAGSRRRRAYGPGDGDMGAGAEGVGKANRRPLPVGLFSNNNLYLSDLKSFPAFAVEASGGSTCNHSLLNFFYISLIPSLSNSVWSSFEIARL